MMEEREREEEEGGRVDIFLLHLRHQNFCESYKDM